jgi:hypothetical protein
MVLVSLVCLLSDRCRANVTQSVVHVYTFISHLLIGTNYTYMCVAKHIRRNVVHFQLCLLILGVRIDFFIFKHLDSDLPTFACFCPSLIPHDLAWFTICTLTPCI